MSALIFVTQLIDESDPALGFVPALIRALTRQFDRVGVIANEVRHIPLDLEPEVVSLGKERGRGQLSRGATYEAVLWRMARELRADAVLAHQCPAYLNLAAPITKVLGLRSMLWFAHPSQEPSLRLAERLADVILTSVPGAYPRGGIKVKAIGQAIDTETFAAPPVEIDGTLRMVAIGRTSPAKHLDVCIRALAEARRRGVDVRLDIYGPSMTAAEEQVRADLSELIRAFRLEGAVGLNPGVPHSRVPGLLETASVLVNAASTGTADKAVFEAMSARRLVLVSNRAFAGILSGLPVELTFAEDGDEGLTARIEQIAKATASDVRRTVESLRARVEESHSIDHWASQVRDAVFFESGRAAQGR